MSDRPGPARVNIGSGRRPPAGAVPARRASATRAWARRWIRSIRRRALDPGEPAPLREPRRRRPRAVGLAVTAGRTPPWLPGGGRLQAGQAAVEALDRLVVGQRLRSGAADVARESTRCHAAPCRERTSSPTGARTSARATGSHGDSAAGQTHRGIGAAVVEGEHPSVPAEDVQRRLRRPLWRAGLLLGIAAVLVAWSWFEWRQDEVLRVGGARADAEVVGRRLPPSPTRRPRRGGPRNGLRR